MHDSRARFRQVKGRNEPRTKNKLENTYGWMWALNSKTYEKSPVGTPMGTHGYPWVGVSCRWFVGSLRKAWVCNGWVPEPILPHGYPNFGSPMGTHPIPRRKLQSFRGHKCERASCALCKKQTCLNHSKYINYQTCEVCYCRCPTEICLTAHKNLKSCKPKKVMR